MGHVEGDSQGPLAPEDPMHRSTARFLAIVAAVAFGGCGYKPAGSVSPAGAAGTGGRGERAAPAAPAAWSAPGPAARAA